MSRELRRKLLRKLKRWAEDRFPVLFPVRVYLRPKEHMQEMLGYFAMNDDFDRGTIGILDTLNHGEIIDTFLEEWAHARCAHLLDTEDNDDDPDHHPTFWSEYGRLVKAGRLMVW